MITQSDLSPPQPVTWCKGCGNFGILAALRKALVGMDTPQHKYVLVSGIGCSGKVPHYINLNSFHTLHGRPIPVATGIKMARPDLKVIVHTGDGDCLGEGLGHFVHAARRNVDIAVFIHNNGVNGLTKGQFSPTAPRGYVSGTSPPPPGAPMEPVNPVALALISGATYVARGFAGHQASLVRLMQDAITHRGFAVVDILQPCVTWNRVLTWSFYNGHIFDIGEDGHDPSDHSAALRLATAGGDRIPVGLFYRSDAPTLADGLSLPESGALADHVNDLGLLQQVLRDMQLE